MTRDQAQPARSTEPRWIVQGLSVIVLLALFAPAPTIAGTHDARRGAVVAHLAGLPVIVVERADEEPTLWHTPDALPITTGPVVITPTAVAPLREALLALPPPARA